MYKIKIMINGLTLTRTENDIKIVKLIRVGNFYDYE